MQPLLLLHGAIGAADQLQPLAARLGETFKVYTLDFTGHGSSAASEPSFAIELFADDVLLFMKQHNLGKVSIFGYSMGGYVAMYLAKHYPEKIDKVVTLATKFHWDAETAAKEIKMLNPEKIAQKLPAFAETLRQRHLLNDWKVVLQKTTEMMTALGNNSPLKPEDHTSIVAPVLVLLGDRDKMVSLDETVNVYRSLPNGQLGILPATPHPIEQADTETLSFSIMHFLLPDHR